MLILLLHDVGNLQNEQGGHGGSHATTWAAIAVSAHQVFPATFNKEVAFIISKTKSGATQNEMRQVIGKTKSAGNSTHAQLMAYI